MDAPAGVACSHRTHTLQMLEDRLHAPEAAAREHRGLAGLRSCQRRVYVWFREGIAWLGSRPATNRARCAPSKEPRNQRDCQATTDKGAAHVRISLPLSRVYVCAPRMDARAIRA